ncbi:alpha-galactosidase [Priestia endophytica]|uniref:alpha-galactosidase n=1 Tax=Priestia endophytica TaxID=135735 RepID=UPI000F524275|nr:alpha-galactosidase [Priestia endophytica]RPK15225.1 Alpha-galactosidase [Priestia endophytica]
MTIIYNEETKEFHLYNNEMSYIMKVIQNNQLGQLYFGKKVPHRASFDYLVEMQHRPMTAYPFQGNLYFSLDHLKQEYPSYGTSDFRHPALEIHQKNGSRITNFQYKTHKIYRGKPKLANLPATYTEHDDEATTLQITLLDSVISVELVLLYTIFEGENAIARSARFKNVGTESVDLTTAMSANLDLPHDDYEWIQLSGAWGRERHIKNRKLEQGIQSVGSIRGNSSLQHNPFIALKRPHADEFQGEVMGFSLVYSGNFLAQAEVDTHGQTRVMMGIHPHGFTWHLEKDEEFQTPEAVIVYSDKGINGMSQTYHRLYRTRLVRGEWRDKTRPVLINNWEATYFDFDEEKILAFAQAAKEDGIELFVLDDGWFGERNDDKRGLGDWVENREKLPSGISGLAQKIEEIGMKFGLWFEPEMVNKNSNLYREHPEWMIETPERRASHGRNQFVLDFSRKEVVDHIYEMMANILKDGSVSYVKWDMNRSMTEVYSKAYDAKRQGEIFHRYILGVYDLYERLTSAFPHVLFESCASGGGRFDPGMLYYAPQTWTSDDTDAIERLKIQYGTSLVYPLSSMGAHVSAVPNEQAFRTTPLETRANVAYFGSFGYELDVTKLSEAERDAIKKQVAFFKQYRALLSQGTFYRLLSPFEGNFTAWMVVSEDKKEAIVGYYKVLNEVNGRFRRLHLKGLDPDKSYWIEKLNENFSGSELMNIGLVTSDSSAGQDLQGNKPPSDFSSVLYVLRAQQ